MARFTPEQRARRAELRRTFRDEQYRLQALLILQWFAEGATLEQCGEYLAERKTRGKKWDRPAYSTAHVRAVLRRAGYAVVTRTVIEQAPKP